MFYYFAESHQGSCVCRLLDTRSCLRVIFYGSHLDFEKGLNEVEKERAGKISYMLALQPDR